jgi:hypothetical protein
MRKIVALGAVAAASLVLSGCGQPSLGSAGAGTMGGATFSGAVSTPAATATVAATALSRADLGDMSGWVAEPGNFGPIGAAASTDALIAAGFAVSKLEGDCPIEHVVASGPLEARGVNLGNVSEGRLHGIFFSDKVRTAKGVHAGSSAAELRSAYGSSLVDTPWRWGEGGADTRAKVLFDEDGALLFLMGPKDSVAGMMSAAGSSLDQVDLLIGGGC